MFYLGVVTSSDIIMQFQIVSKTKLVISIEVTAGPFPSENPRTKWPSLSSLLTSLIRSRVLKRNSKGNSNAWIDLTNETGGMHIPVMKLTLTVDIIGNIGIGRLLTNNRPIARIRLAVLMSPHYLKNRPSSWWFSKSFSTSSFSRKYLQISIRDRKSVKNSIKLLSSNVHITILSTTTTTGHKLSIVFCDCMADLRRYEQHCWQVMLHDD